MNKLLLFIIFLITNFNYDTKTAIGFTIIVFIPITLFSYILKLYLLPKYLIWVISNVTDYNSWYDQAYQNSIIFNSNKYLFWSKKDKEEYMLKRKKRFGQPNLIREKYDYKQETISLYYSNKKDYILIGFLLTALIVGIIYVNIAIMIICVILIFFFGIYLWRRSKKVQLVISKKGLTMKPILMMRRPQETKSAQVFLKWSEIYNFEIKYENRSRFSFSGVSFFGRQTQYILAVNFNEQILNNLTLTADEINDLIPCV